MERGNAKILMERNCVRYTVARVPHDGRRASRSAKWQNSLHRHIHGGHVERFQHDLLEGVVLVSLPVHQGFRGLDKIVLGRDSELVVKKVVP